LNFAITVFIALAIILTVFFLTSVKLELVYEKTDIDSEAEIYIKYLFIKKKLNSKEKKKKETTSEEKDFLYYKKKIDEGTQIFKIIKPDILKILKYCRDRLIVIDKLDFNFRFGLEEPMYTGVLNGTLYAFVYNILALIHHNMKIKKSRINIVPDFDNVCHNVRFNCILSLKNVHIIVIIIKILKVFKKINKEGSN